MKKRKTFKKIMTLILAAIITIGTLAVIPEEASAATPIKSTINMVTKRSMTVIKGNRYRMKAVINGKTIKSQGKWASSNKKVATVSKTGIIKAVKAGKTKISVKYKGKTLRTAITVSNTCKHVWKTTKKATCETKGTKKCSVCGATQSIAKTAHSYKTEKWDAVEGRGKTYYVTTWFCNGCDIDMTDWTRDEMDVHQTDIDNMLAGKANMDCFCAGTHGAVNVERYNKYVMAHNEEAYCTKCGEPKDLTVTDLYEVYYDDWRNVVRKSDNEILEESLAYKNYKPYLEAQRKAETEDSTVAARAAVAPQDVTIEDTEETNETPVDTEIVTESVVSDNTITNETTDETVSETVVSENETN